METFKPKLEILWIPFKKIFLHATYNFMAPDVTRRMIDLWGRLCRFMDTTEDGVRQKRMKEGECLYWECSKKDGNNPKERTKETKECKRCRFARYCSVECQKL